MTNIIIIVNYFPLIRQPSIPFGIYISLFPSPFVQIIGPKE